MLQPPRTFYRKRCPNSSLLFFLVFLLFSSSLRSITGLFSLLFPDCPAASWPDRRAESRTRHSRRSRRINQMRPKREENGDNVCKIQMRTKLVADGCDWPCLVWVLVGSVVSASFPPSLRFCRLSCSLLPSRFGRLATACALRAWSTPRAPQSPGIQGLDPSTK